MPPLAGHTLGPKETLVPPAPEACGSLPPLASSGLDCKHAQCRPEACRPGLATVMPVRHCRRALSAEPAALKMVD